MGEDELSEIVGICKRPVSVFLMKIMNAEKMRGWHADLVIDSCTAFHLVGGVRVGRKLLDYDPSSSQAFP